MPDPSEFLGSILQQLARSARPRPDLVGADQGGAPFGSPDYAPAGSEEQRPYTFAGRVLNAGDRVKVADVLKHLPIHELETGGRAIMAPADLMALMAAGKSLAGLAFHGSPHKFEQFDMSKIGTGEGSQSRGHGLYFAEAEGTGRRYQEILGNRGQDSVTMRVGSISAPIPKYIGEMITSVADKPTKMQALAKGMGYIKQELQGVREALQRTESTVGLGGPRLREARVKKMKQDIEQYEKGLAILRTAREVGDFKISPSGHLYKVDIPDEHISNMLDWDKPLSQQSKTVQDAVTKPITLNGTTMPEGLVPVGELNDWTGEMLMRDLQTYGKQGWYGIHSSADVSKILHSRGIPGIKFLDAGSRHAGEGTHNFVLFDTKYLSKVERVE